MNKEDFEDIYGIVEKEIDEATENLKFIIFKKLKKICENDD